MSMTTQVVFLRDKNDPKHQAKVKVLRSCMEAGIDPPPEIDEYFGGTEEEDLPLEIDFEAREWRDECSEGYEIDIGEIPEGVKTIRFYNSY